MINMPPYFGTIYSREHEPVVFTSNPFPYYFEDNMRVNDMDMTDGLLRQGLFVDDMRMTDFGITGGTLTETIRYQSYTPPNTENIKVADFGIVAGTLNITINYINYNIATENIKVADFGIVSGELS